MENIVVYYLFVYNISLLVTELLSCTFIKQKRSVSDQFTVNER